MNRQLRTHGLIIAIPLDYVAAYKWYSLAQQAGDKNSRASIKNLLRVMTPAQVSQAKTMLVSFSPGL